MNCFPTPRILLICIFLILFYQNKMLIAQIQRKPIATFLHDNNGPGPNLIGPIVFNQGRQLLTWNENTVKISPIIGGKPNISFQHQDYIADAEIMIGNQQFMVWCMGGTVKIWDMAGGDPINTFKIKAGLTSAKIIGNEKQLLTLGSDGMAKIWDIVSGEP